MSRIVCQFSCGAASAVATKLILAKYSAERVLIVNAFLIEEHEDNRRFLSECEQWFGHPVTVLTDTKYGASTDEVWMRKRFMKGPHGAPCSMHLKRELLAAISLPGDIDSIGYTVEEEDRLNDLREIFPSRTIIAPLVEANLTKADCLAMVERAGIKLPEMYLLGFDNANCIGCPKGGQGYWNKIRVTFPERFNRVAEIQEAIGPGAYFFRNRKTGERYSLRDLDPESGSDSEPEISCSFFCEMAEQDIGAALVSRALDAPQDGAK